MGHTSIASWDGSYDGYNSVGGVSPFGFILTDQRAGSPDFNTDVMLTDLEVSVADPNAVLHIVVGRVEISDGWSGSGKYFRDTPSSTSLPGLAAGYNFPYGFHHIMGAYFLSGGHPLQIHYDEPLEAFRDAETGTDQAIAIWLKRVDSDDGVGFHVNVRFEVNN